MVNAAFLQSCECRVLHMGVQSAALPLMRGVIVVMLSMLLLLVEGEQTPGANFFVVAGTGGL